MSIEGQKFHPGENATADELTLLAIEYHRAAAALFRSAKRGKPLSWAPFRWAVLHAIELYLSAFLIGNGRSPKSIWRHRHDLGARADLAQANRLGLRKSTVEHL